MTTISVSCSVQRGLNSSDVKRKFQFDRKYNFPTKSTIYRLFVCPLNLAFRWTKSDNHVIFSQKASNCTDANSGSVDTYQRNNWRIAAHASCQCRVTFTSPRWIAIECHWWQGHLRQTTVAADLRRYLMTHCSIQHGTARHAIHGGEALPLESLNPVISATG
jgi:hypothetical protein